MNKVEQIKRILVEGYRGSYPRNREQRRCPSMGRRQAIVEACNSHHSPMEQTNERK